MSAPYSPLSLSSSSETVALGSAIAGTTPQFVGCTTPAYSISPSLAGTGLTFDSATGRLSGTPKAATAGTLYTISVGSGSEASASATYSLTVTGTSSSTGESNSTSGTTPNSGNTETGTAISGGGSAALPTEPGGAETSTAETPVVDVTAPLASKLRLKVYFDLASYKVTAASAAKLQTFAEKIVGLGSKIKISVTGYAQPTPGSEMTDGALSENRAIAVSKALKKFGVTTRVAYQGAGRAAVNIPSSRYVEIVVEKTN
jgi:outer membrane protein OmpA-like peptidoglycan-associated protein